MHLDKTNLFKSVKSKDIGEFSIENGKLIDGLINEGYDILILADLYHFYGYQSGKASSNTAAFLFGAAGVLVEAMANKKIVGGRAALGDLKIVDLKNKKILWEGDLNYDFERKDTFYNGAQSYAIEALKQVNDKLAIQINEVLNNEKSLSKK